MAEEKKTNRFVDYVKNNKKQIAIEVAKAVLLTGVGIFIGRMSADQRAIEGDTVNVVPEMAEPEVEPTADVTSELN